MTRFVSLLVLAQRLLVPAHHVALSPSFIDSATHVHDTENHSDFLNLKSLQTMDTGLSRACREDDMNYEQRHNMLTGEGSVKQEH
jgi:hypothetical protein